MDSQLDCYFFYSSYSSSLLLHFLKADVEVEETKETDQEGRSSAGGFGGWSGGSSSGGGFGGGFGGGGFGGGGASGGW